MRAITGLAVGVVVLTALASGTARAAPSFATKYSYYTVSGRSTTSIFASLLRRSLQVNGRRHHAITSIDISRPKIVRSAKGCSVSGPSIRFLIRLPRLDNEASLSASDRRLWQQFSTFVRQHEERHRAIWMGCARTIEASLRGKSCGQIERTMRRVIDQAKAACRKQDAAFDAVEQSRLENHPFIRSALAPVYAPPKKLKKL
jgi:predicted secreted Zn-dependent protease